MIWDLRSELQAQKSILETQGAEPWSLRSDPRVLSSKNKTPEPEFQGLRQTLIS